MRYQRQTKTLSERELKELDAELNGYARTRFNTHFGRDVTSVDQRAWLHDKGAMKDGAIVVTNHTTAKYNAQGRLEEPQDCEPILYEELMSLWEQWVLWKGRKEYAKSQELQDMEALAATSGF